MDYFQAAFGIFAPQRDEDAAIKFVLNVILMDDRLQELTELVVGEKWGGIEGEPGWLLERRSVVPVGNETAHRHWPAGARFKASVDEDAYTLEHPEFFMNRDEFMNYLARAIEAYVAADPSSRDTNPSVIALRKATGYLAAPQSEGGSAG